MPANIPPLLECVTSADIAASVPYASESYRYVGSVFPMRRCVECFSTMMDFDTTSVDTGISGCADCISFCDRCSDAAPSDDFMPVHASHSSEIESWCEVCVDTFAGRCNRCDDMFPSSSLETGHNYSRLCGECALAEQEEQERWEAEEAEREEMRNIVRVIREYHDRDRKAETAPVLSPWVTANNGRLIGVELEVELPDARWAEVERVAGSLLGAANISASVPMLWAERDGSIANGFEMITQPTGLDRQRDLWSAVLSHPDASVMRSHNTTTCGLHVHVSRAGLSQYTLAKAVVFLNDRRNYDLIHAIARRYDTGYCKQKFVYFGKKCTTDSDRYVMLNTTPKQTVEFRLFRGSTRSETVLGCIEFANAVLNFCRDTAPADLLWSSFLKWVQSPANRADSRNLRALITRRAPGILPAKVKGSSTQEFYTVNNNEE